jgi:two-component system sensor histidine kinase and response regulator WspE
MQEEALQALEIVAASLAETNARDVERLEEIRQCVRQCHESLSQRIDELETTEGRSTELAHRLYDAVLDSRMRPLADGVHAFPRMVRDLARALGKEVRLELVGQAVQVDRDVLEKLESPLGHLLRNATDHGIESPDARRMAGKPAIGLVRLEARHSAGLLQIVVSDDGRGVDLDRVRHAVLARNLASEDAVQRMSEAEVLEFLFLPGFTLKETVTDVSGRGVGLDAVRNMVRQLRGSVRVSAQPGAGTRVQLQLPLTLSVVRALLIAVAGEPYAIPLTQIVRALRVPRRVVHSLEGREYLEFDGRSVGLVSAQLVLDVEAGEFSGDELAVVMIGGGGAIYGLVVEAFLGERELVVQPLDPRFGKLQDIAAGGLLEDGSPVLIVDVEDMVRSVEKLVSSGELGKAGAERSVRGGMRRRVLVVDDSLTVRELERKLLDHAGYEVEVAVDGMDGWNALRTGRFDLVVTDVDMPRLGGIELVEMIRRDARLKTLPVMIVSYKDRDEDRRRGLEAGADYYLAKSSFHDETLLQAVADLIGEAA